MSTINTNIPSVTAQRHLLKSQSDLGLSLERLSSGLRINRGADDPAGLIVSERIRTEISALEQAIDNSNRAVNVIATAEGALDEVAALLVDIRALVLEAANTGAFSDDETKANQLQIDDAIDSITRIANTTTFAGQKLLDGQLGYVLSGVVGTELGDVQVLGANFGSEPFIDVTVNVSQSAKQAELFFTSAVLDGANSSIDIQGPNGIVTLTFPASATSIDMVTAINAETDSTGVQAVALGSGGSAGVRIESLAFGSDAFVSVETLSGNFTVENTDGLIDSRAEGQDALATINGTQTVADGLELSVSSTKLSVDLVLDEDFGAGTSSFTIVSGGALFQLGPEASSNLQENIGIRSVQANKLGNSIVGYLADLKSGQNSALATGNFKEATDILVEAIDQVSTLRGRLGAFERNTLRTNISQLQITVENLTSSESVIRDTDFARETSELTRAQILVQAGNSVLAIANAQSQNVLTLLGG